MPNDRLYTPLSHGVTPDDLVRRSSTSGFSYIPRQSYGIFDLDTTFASFDWTKVAVFIEGSCPENGTESARAGMGVFFGQDSPYNIRLPLLTGRKTSQTAEILAAVCACRMVKYLCLLECFLEEEVVFITDSYYVVKSITDWIDNWKVNGWRRVDGEPVVNKKELSELDEIVTQLETRFKLGVRFWHVPRRYNAEADRLAREAASPSALATKKCVSYFTPVERSAYADMIHG